MLGFIGGSGFYKFLTSPREERVETPYGAPAASLTLGELAGQTVAFLPRHGVKHEYPPHRVPYRANVWALKQAGVTRVVTACAVGSLNPAMKPGDFILLDQFVDRTWGREATFFDGPETVHTAMADPYCPLLRELVIASARYLNFSLHTRGTVVVVQGPRFSTRAESKSFRESGCDVINMTQCPEAALARELKLCYSAVALVTDYDVGVEGDLGMRPVTHEEVLKVFAQNIERVKTLFTEIAKRYTIMKDDCSCRK